MPFLATRITVRRGTNRTQATQALGMRCGLAKNPTDPVAENVLRASAPSSFPPKSYSPEFAMGPSKWTHQRGTARPESDRVITSFNHLTFVTKKMEVHHLDKLGAERRKGGLELGLLSTTVDLLYPKLQAETYALYWVVDEEIARGES